MSAQRAGSARPDPGPPERLTLHPARATATATATAQAIATTSATAAATPAGARPAVLVLPGGGYEEHAHASSEPFAEWWASIGVHAALLRYPVAPRRHPAPLEAARAAFEWLRSGGSGLDIDATRVGVVGSSAGGHLAACLATGIDAPDAARPAFCVLSAPVVSLEHPTRDRPLVNLLGPDASPALRRALSVETRVDERTPPTFVWTTADDRVVSATHAISYVDALVRHAVPVEFHLFPHGRHGLGTAVREPHAGQWRELCERWLRVNRFL